MPGNETPSTPVNLLVHLDDRSRLHEGGIGIHGLNRHVGHDCLPTRIIRIAATIVDTNLTVRCHLKPNTLYQLGMEDVHDVQGLLYKLLLGFQGPREDKSH